MISKRAYFFLAKITLLALVISAIPLPKIVAEASPFWILLFFTYWVVHFPGKDHFFIALMLGVVIDILHGDIIGHNALALILSSAFITKVKQSFMVSNLSTQQIYVFVAASIYLGLFLLVQVLIEGLVFSHYLWLTPLSSALLWPLINLMLKRFKH